MIISHKNKLLFIGLPFSASSAISKELYLQHEGQALLTKHSLYHEFKKTATKEELDYFVFCVLRNPMDIAVTIYEKMKKNSKGNFTNPELFIENGGHITKKHREQFDFIHKNQATFQQYFKSFFKNPYDNLVSLTVGNCDYVIRYESISENYLFALKKAGIKNPRPLPVANKTEGKKKDVLAYYTEEIQERAIYVFGPFLEKYNYPFPASWGKVEIPLTSKVKFFLFGFLRSIYTKNLRKVTEKIGLQGTIYGDIQRNKLNKL